MTDPMTTIQIDLLVVFVGGGILLCVAVAALTNTINAARDRILERIDKVERKP